jgi:hypothetical protein
MRQETRKRNAVREGDSEDELDHLRKDNERMIKISSSNFRMFGIKTEGVTEGLPNGNLQKVSGEKDERPKISAMDKDLMVKSW